MNKLPKNPLPFPLTGCYLAGGAILSVVTKTEVSDYDIYPKSKEALIEVLYEIEDNDCFVVNVSNRAITWKCDSIVKDNGERAIIQVMTFDEFDSPKKIFDFFDFSVCMAAFDSDTEEYHFHENFWPSVASKTLYFNPGTRYPLNSAIRVGKYTSKGYYLPKPESIKMSLAVIKSGMPESWEELENAIGGSYGRQLKLDVDNKPYSYEAALEILDNIVLDFMAEDEDFTMIKAEHLERALSDEKMKILKIKKNGSYLSSAITSNIHPITDGVIDKALSFGEQEALERLGVEMEEISKDEVFYGYKMLKKLESGAYENTVHRKKLNYRVGEYMEETESPHIHVWARPDAHYTTLDRGSVLCRFTFLASDIVSVSSSEIKVKKVFFEKADAVMEKMQEKRNDKTFSFSSLEL